MNIEEFNDWIQTYKNDDDGKFTAYVSTMDLHQLCKDYTKQQLSLCAVSDSKRVEWHNGIFLDTGFYKVETNLGRTFEAMYSLNRWFESDVDILEGETVVAYYC